jgi:hypothetical protein
LARCRACARGAGGIIVGPRCAARDNGRAGGRGGLAAGLAALLPGIIARWSVPGAAGVRALRLTRLARSNYACCFPDGSCVDIHHLKCLVLCGTPGGKDSACESTRCKQAREGDADLDGDTDDFDLLLFLGTWGPCTDDNDPCPPDPCAADFDGNGTVDIF